MEITTREYGDCLPKAIEIFYERINLDTNLTIVKMLSPRDGSFLNHWYFRSDQFIGNPFKWTDIDGKDIPPYVGDAKKASIVYYGKGLFEVDEELTQRLLNSFAKDK